MGIKPTPNIEALPNGYKDAKSYFAPLGGLLIHAGDFFLSFGYHSRRGWIAGIGLSW